MQVPRGDHHHHPSRRRAAAASRNLAPLPGRGRVRLGPMIVRFALPRAERRERPPPRARARPPPKAPGQIGFTVGHAGAWR